MSHQNKTCNVAEKINKLMAQAKVEMSDSKQKDVSGKGAVDRGDFDIAHTGTRKDHVVSIIGAVRDDKVDLLKLILKKSAPGQSLDIALCVAAQKGHVACLDEILKVTPNVQPRCTATMAAAAFGHQKCLHSLVGKTSQVAVPDSCKSDALALAAMKGHFGCVKEIMLSGAGQIANERALAVALMSQNVSCATILAEWADHEKALSVAVGMFGDAVAVDVKMLLQEIKGVRAASYKSAFGQYPRKPTVH